MIRIIPSSPPLQPTASHQNQISSLAAYGITFSWYKYGYWNDCKYFVKNTEDSLKMTEKIESEIILNAAQLFTETKIIILERLQQVKIPSPAPLFSFSHLLFFIPLSINLLNKKLLIHMISIAHSDSLVF